jgi:hypothetical protein
LPERLLAKDKEFRGVNTHHVAGHENVKEDVAVRDARVKAWLDAEDAKKTK